MTPKKKIPSSSPKPPNPGSVPSFIHCSLRDLERRVHSKGQKWMEDRMKEELQNFTDEHGEVSPLSQASIQKRQRRLLRLYSNFGNVVV